MPCDELPKDLQWLPRAVCPAQFGERFDWILKAGRVVKAEEIEQPEQLAPDGLSGHRADPHLIVLGKRRHHRGLAVIDRADDGERRDIFAHFGVHFSIPIWSRLIALKFRQCFTSSSLTGANEPFSFGPTR